MGAQFLYAIILLIAVIAVFVFYRLTVEREKERSHLSYNLGIPCPDGAAFISCPHCGEVFGSETVEAARQECESKLKTAPSDTQGTDDFADLFQRIRWNVACPSCGRKSSYVPHARILLYQGDW